MSKPVNGTGCDHFLRTAGVAAGLVFLMLTGGLGWAQANAKGLEQARYAARAGVDVDTLWVAANLHQGFVARFGDEAVRLIPRQPESRSWQWGLQLVAWGSELGMQSVPPAAVTADGNRVEYRRGLLTEWYSNRPDGLEQGFIVAMPSGIWSCRISTSGIRKQFGPARATC